jgi:hypothetical protein
LTFRYVDLDQERSEATEQDLGGSVLGWVGVVELNARQRWHHGESTFGSEVRK